MTPLTKRFRFLCNRGRSADRQPNRPLALQVFLTLPHFNSQLFQLCFADWRGGIDHQVNRFRRLWEGDHFAQAFSSSKDHYDPVKAKRYAAMRRRAELQRFQEETEARACFFITHSQRAKNLFLDVLAMNTN